MTTRLRDGVMKRGATWSYVVRVRDASTGRSSPKWVGGFRTEAEAKEARDNARVAAPRGEYVDRSSVTVEVYLREWLLTHSVAVKPKTLSGYRYDVEHYVIPHIGGLRLQSLRPATISKLYRELLDRGGRGAKPLSPRTVDHVHRTLRKALGDAVRVDQSLTSNPVERATRPHARHEDRGGVWNPTQLNEFLTAASRHRLGAFYRLAAYTGARRGELLNLRWTDLDLEASEVTFSGSTDVIDGQRVEGTTKGGRRRIVSLDTGTVDIMREHRKAQRVERMAAGRWWCDDDDLVFRAQEGSPLHPDSVTALARKLIAASDLPPARLHDLRHVHATTLLLAGVPVHVVAARLGHADPAITLRVYAHVLREHAAGVADVFARAVGGSQRPLVSKGVSKIDLGATEDGRASR